MSIYRCKCPACRRERSLVRARLALPVVAVLLVTTALIYSIGCATTGSTIENPPPAVRMVEE